MGLDLVELVMEVEDEFAITIPDADAEKIQTVGDLYQYVLQRTGHPAADAPPPAVCGSARSFYRLRAAFGALGADRALVRPTPRGPPGRWPRICGRPCRAAWRSGPSARRFPVRSAERSRRRQYLP